MTKKTLSLYVTTVIFILFYMYMITFSLELNKNLLNISLFFLIQIISLIKVINEIRKKPYSLNMMHWFFIFMFYGIAGFIQYMHNNFAWSTITNDETILNVQLIILLWIFAYMIGEKIILMKNKQVTPSTQIFNSELLYSKKFIILSTIVSCATTIIVLITVGIEASLSRDVATFTTQTQMSRLLIDNILRNMIIYGLAISAVNIKKKGKGWIWGILQLICLLIVNSPISMARFNVAIVYLGLLILLSKSMKKGFKFSVIFLFSFIIIFPVINVFRRATLGEINIQQVVYETVSGISTGFLAGDYDAFTMVINTFYFVNEYGITYGRQLLGSMLFFIPRIFWPNKPVGSGHTVLMARGDQFTNVSSPLIAEGLINFGLLGVLIFGFFFGKTISRIDKAYWKGIREGNGNLLNIIYPFLLFMFFFMNRGDLLSTLSFTMSHVVVCFLLFKINNLLSEND